MESNFRDLKEYSNYTKAENVDKSNVKSHDYCSSTTSLNGNADISHIVTQKTYLAELCMYKNRSKLKNHMNSSPCIFHSSRNGFDPSESSSKSNIKVPVAEKATFVKYQDVIQDSNDENNVRKEETNPEKATYCRPVVNTYTQEFVHKTMERNVRLQQLVHRLVLAREKEKQNEAWNNYINELKNKHGHYDILCPSKVATVTPEDENSDLIIDDHYNNGYISCKHPCRRILNDIYSSSYMAGSYENPERSRGPSNNRPYKYGSTYCFPTASQGRLMMSNRRRLEKQLGSCWRNQPVDRYFHGNTIVIETNPKQSTGKNLQTKHLNRIREIDNKIKTMSTQTQQNILNNRGCMKWEEDVKASNVKDSGNADITEQKTQQPLFDTNRISLSHIENKLDVLIQSINALMGEVRSKKVLRDNKTAAVSCCNIIKNVNETKSDSCSLMPRKEVICGFVDDKSISNQIYSNNESKRQRSMDAIWVEEMNKTNKVKKDIDKILDTSDRQCAVQITFDIPTKDHSTEVTDSLYKNRVQEQVIVEEINRTEDRRMTIAVNTDPLGILALFRVSTETVKQILSYVPNIEYLSTLAKSQFQQASSSEEHSLSRFVCNICGASFSKPSRLSDHIQRHNLTERRDCCICRHVIDMKRHCSGLFACQFCGQMFTRAYCRELHQQACAKRLGRKHDISPSLMLLS